MLVRHALMRFIGVTFELSECALDGVVAQYKEHIHTVLSLYQKPIVSIVERVTKAHNNS